MITYNHGPYIAKAIESVLMQKTAFPLRLFIGEDQSTDSTRQICIDYARRFPDKISLRLNDVNFLIKNSSSTYYAAFRSGAKYIAMLEGDDYFIDPLKIQKQVDVMEKDHAISLVGHRVQFVDPAGNPLDNLKSPETPQILTGTDIAERGCIVHTASICYRNLFGPNEFPHYFFKLKTGDFALLLLLCKAGNIFMLDEKLSAYRIHRGGAWSVKSNLEMYLNIAFNLDMLIAENFGPEQNAGMVNQNRNNFRHLLAGALNNSDSQTIDRILGASARIDPGFPEYFVREILFPHLQLQRTSGSHRMARRLSKLAGFLKKR